MRKQRREPDGRDRQDRQDGQDTNRIVPAVLVILVATFSWTLTSAQQPTASVTSQDLRDGLKNPTRWLTYGGDYGNLRHSPLTQITPANVNRLVPQWQFQTDTLGKFEAAPLVFDGVVYVTGPLDTGWALDARTGRQIWRYRRDLPSGLIACCGLVNRGFGILGDRLSRRRSMRTSWRSAARPARSSGIRRWRISVTATAGRPRRSW